MRTHDAKLATYSYWKPGGMDVDTSRPIEREFYDYSTRLGAQEVDNQADRNPKEAGLQELLDHKVLAEVRAPLPAFLDDAQQQGLADMRRLVARRGADRSCIVPRRVDVYLTARSRPASATDPVDASAATAGPPRRRRRRDLTAATTVPPPPVGPPGMLPPPPAGHRPGGTTRYCAATGAGSSAACGPPAAAVSMAPG
ncbi:sulfatase domain protein [Mycobacterium xenopi 4042]|uniref:Sulfatase domain protein n=1 Tax=Mycobacterium xenopi 4042 TaxID=1299334 RepID=X8BE34_MYCXE|nr:sulfatase domain protein [Mycobacterium xenopi 4042]